MSIPLRKTLLVSLLGVLSITACKSLGTPEDQAAADELWGKMSNYSEWAQFPGHEGMQPGASPHGKFIDVYVNSIGASNTAAPGYGTVIVKANYAKEDRSTLKALTVMERIEGFDPENGDWFWARYTPSGEKTHSGKVGMCADCHFDADDDDFVFLND